ncbi:ATP-binding protein [Pseudooceanicola sp. LIPI14-2-Ac024]|uniref:ATP-binding protein n=1 Tax=Pseudooceanicola sp. LIPI14-2-Ac024 TaxID=3344875 RepID=UPI0035D0EA8A
MAIVRKATNGVLAEVTGTAGPNGSLTRLSVSLGSALTILPLVSLALLGLALFVPTTLPTQALASAALAVLIAYAILRLLQARHRMVSGAAVSAVEALIARDPTPGYLTTGDGEILFTNDAARRAFGQPGPDGLSGALGDQLANPGGLLRRMRGRALNAGAASEDVVTAHGQARITVHRLDGGELLWRLQTLTTPGHGVAAQQDVALLTVGRSNSVLFMNQPARQLAGQRPKSLEALFDALPLRPGEMHEMRGADGPVNVRVLQVSEAGGRRELMLLPEAKSAVVPLPDRTGPGDIDTLPIPLLLIGTDGRIEACNAPARDLLGADCVPGTALSALTEGLGRSISDWLAEAAAGREPVHSEFLRLSNPDQEVFVQVTVKCVEAEGEVRLLAVLSDATELKTLEAQFVQSQKMQAIGQLAGGVAHDFNNLLTAISGHCDLLLLRHDPGDPDYSELIQIHQNANRAASLVGQLLAFSRKQTLRPELLDLRDTLSDLTHLLNRLVGERVMLSVTHDPLLRPIRADKRQLEQVIMNLVVNARDAMPDGGEIRVETETLRLSEPLRRDRVEVPAGEYVSVKVIDNGRGITPDKLTKVFEPFFTTKRVGEGTGLGLSTAYGIVKQTGGYIFVDSDPGVGTCFTLLFPVHEGDSRQEMPVLPRTGAPPRPGRGQIAEGIVLLVEDEAPVRAFAAQALRLRGYTVIEAESAEAALDLLADGKLKVDLFVTDVVMPGRDGPSWVREALERRPDTAVVFVSGYAEEHFADSHAGIPNSVFLPKPFSLSELTDAVHRQLH